MRIAVAIAAVFGAREPLAHEVSLSGTREIMEQLSRSFRGIETALAEGDLARVERLAVTFGSGRLVQIDELAPLEAVLLAETQHRLTDLGTELALLAQRGDRPAAEQAFDELRDTCVSCHVRFRDELGDETPYPGKANTLEGQLEVRTVDGELREDRSHAVVFLEGIRAAGPWPLPRVRPRISQHNRSFVPRILPIVKGTTVEFPNDDTIFHNVFSLSRTRPFDLDVYPPGESRSLTFPRTGLVRVYCNIHPKMSATIVILDNPYYTLTDRDGRFVIPGVPDGSYTLRAWNELGGETQRRIEVEGGRLVHFQLELEEKKTSLGHKNKFGKPYRKKY